MDFKQNYKNELEKELNQFLFLCGKNDGTVLVTKADKNNIGEFVRLSCIATALGYKKLLLKIVAHCDKYFDAFYEILENAGSNFLQIDEWVTRFIDNIEHPEAKKLVRGFWTERKAIIDRNNFNIGSLLE